MEPRPDKPKERKFNSLADFLSEKIVKIEKEEYPKDTEGIEKLVACNKVFDYFLDFSQDKDESYRIQTVIKLQKLLRKERFRLPGKFQSYLSEFTKKKIRSEDDRRFESNIDKNLDFKDPYDRYDDSDLLLMNEFNPDKLKQSEPEKKKERDALLDNYSSEEIEEINKLAKLISEFSYKNRLSFPFLPESLIRESTEKYIRKLFKEGKPRKRVLEEGVNQAIKYIVHNVGNLQNLVQNQQFKINFYSRKARELRKRAEILGKILKEIKLYW